MRPLILVVDISVVKMKKPPDFYYLGGFWSFIKFVGKTISLNIRMFMPFVCVALYLSLTKYYLCNVGNRWKLRRLIGFNEFYV